MESTRPVFEDEGIEIRIYQEFDDFSVGSDADEQPKKLSYLINVV